MQGSSPETASAGLRIESRAIVFEDGLIGCPDWRHFVLEPEAVGPAIHALRCLDAPGVALYVTDPFTILPDYEFDVGDTDSAALDLRSPSDAWVLVVLTVRDDPVVVTANMVGPLVVNVRTSRGRQLVLANAEYSLQHSVNA